MFPQIVSPDLQIIAEVKKFDKSSHSDQKQLRQNVCVTLAAGNSSRVKRGDEFRKGGHIGRVSLWTGEAVRWAGSPPRRG